jgi:lipoprotein-anchoring transpeptidase ErfK/SrfK
MVRVLRVSAVVIVAGLVAGAAAGALLGEQRVSSFASQAASLERTWTHDIAVGVPAASITPLRTQLRSERPQDGWWALWWTTDGSALLDRLQSATTSAYAAAMATQRAGAEAVLSAWQKEVSTNQKWVSASRVAAAQDWPAELAAASTPDKVAALTASWEKQLDTTKTQVLSAQEQAALATGVAAAGGPSGLVAQAQAALSKAKNDTLDPGDVASLEAQLQGELAGGGDVTTTADQLYTALQQLDQLFSLNSQLYGEMRPLELIADQASAEGTPDSAALLAEYQTIDQSYLSGTTYEQLDPLQSQVTTLQAEIQAQLTSDQCGHDVGSGKVITISLSLQEMVVYDNGCVVNATPVTTGRPGLRTPAGDFHVFYKASPFTFVSPWPPGSPYWYPTTTVNWVMEFLSGGYFIHDAYWEAQDAFGPGSQNDVIQDYASHGCVHTPTVFMQWLYSWTPIGTPVIITN